MMCACAGLMVEVEFCLLRLELRQTIMSDETLKDKRLCHCRCVVGDPTISTPRGHKILFLLLAEHLVRPFLETVDIVCGAVPR